MSKNTAPHILRPAEINKKIISKPQKPKSQLEWRNHLGKFRDEYVAEYEEKRNAFLACAKAYNKMNTDTLMNRKVRLHSNYEEMLNLDFLKEKKQTEDDECDPFCCCLKCEPNTTGQLLKKRSLRKMTCEGNSTLETCLIEPWFKRYLILNKFIWAARTVIIQNRLLKVLDKLKHLTINDINTIENNRNQKKCEDFHCHPVFLKFL